MTNTNRDNDQRKKRSEAMADRCKEAGARELELTLGIPIQQARQFIHDKGIVFVTPGFIEEIRKEIIS